MLIKIIVCLIIGYIFGLFQTGYLYGKILYGVDVRKYGSGNAGTTNTIRTLGKPAGYIVFLGDGLKAVFAILLVRYVIFPGLPQTDLLAMITGFGVVLGHDFPFYMHFQGGKGIATTGGVMFTLDIRMAIIAAIVFAIIFFATRYVSVGSLAITALFPFMLLIFFPGQPLMFAVGLLFTAMAWWRHKANIIRLKNGTENRFERKKKNKQE
jgi:glycerol-3-phosphate acyltransferase PlsY